jgi:ketosteroid isomerase-like protein
MSQENVEIALKGLTMFETEDIDGALALMQPDAEWDVSEMPDGKVYRGHEAIRAFWESLLMEVWEEIAMEPERVEAKGDVVVALVRARARGKGSGVPVDFPGAWVATFRGGLVHRLKWKFDQAEALEAVGLSE